MTFTQAMQLMPIWVQIWLNVLLLGAFVLPGILLIWPESRKAGILTLIGSLLSAITITWGYGQIGLVKLLGLPHIVFWTPVAIYLYRFLRRDDIRIWPRRVAIAILGIIGISLMFDYVDVARYLLGERTPIATADMAGSG